VDFTVSWNAVPGVHHYNVSVYWSGQDHVTIVPAGTTSLRVDGVDLRTTYRITVSSRDTAGVGSTTGPIWLNPAVPGAPRSFVVTREPTAVDVRWDAPSWPGYTPISGYHVVVTRLSDKVDVTDTVVTATTSRDPVLRGDWLTEGALVCAIGANDPAARELDSHVITRATLICCDSLEDARLESGDLIEPVAAGQLDWLEVCELHQIVTGELPGRQSDEDVVVFKSNGIAPWDLAIGHEVVRRAHERSVGVSL
jgi:hypothetical protein